MENELTDGITREQVFKNLRRAGRDDLLKNFERNTGQEINPVDLDNQETPELNTRDESDTRMQNAQTGVNNFENDLASQRQTIIDKQKAGEDVTSRDIEILEALRAEEGLKIQEDKIGKAEERKELNEEFDVEGQTKEIQEYQNQLAAEQRSLETAKRRLMENPEGLGSGALQGRIRQIERRSLEKQADIAILGNAARGNLTTSLALIDNRLELEFGDVEERWTNFTDQVEAVSGLTSSVKTKLKEQAQEEKDRISQVRQAKKDAFGLVSQIAQNNPELARQMYGEINMLSEDSTIEDANQVIDSVRSQAIEGGAFSTGATDDFPDDLGIFLSDAINQIQLAETDEERQKLIRINFNNAVARYPQYAEQIRERLEGFDQFSVNLESGDTPLPGETISGDFELTGDRFADDTFGARVVNFFRGGVGKSDKKNIRAMRRDGWTDQDIATSLKIPLSSVRNIK